MNEKYRQNLDPAPSAGNDDSAIAGDGGGLSQKKNEINEMLASADDFIDSAQLQDGETYIEARRQQSGQ